MKRGPLRRVLLIVLLLAVGATVGIGGYTLYRDYRGVPRPAFSLPAVDGSEHSIAEWNHKVIVLNFWASWCAPCRREVPLLIKLQKQYETRGLQVVGVAIDNPDAIRDFANKLGINYPVLYGVEAAMDVAASYGDQQGTLPFTVVIDRKGRMRHVFRKEIKRPEIEPVIRELL